MESIRTILPQFIIIFILILINGFFSATEMAIVSINKNKLKLLIEEGNKKAVKLNELIQEPSKLLSTIQIGITLAGFLASAFAAVGLSEFLSYYLLILKIPYHSQISILIVTIFLSFLTLVFGELIPKRLALIEPEKIALGNIGILMGVYKLFIPFIKVLSFSTNTVLKLFNINEGNGLEFISKEEFKMFIHESEVSGTIKDSEREMIEKIIDFEDKLAREVMIPRTDMFAIEIDTSIEEIFSNSNIIRFSRIPVYKEELDNIVGVLHTKSLLKTSYEQGFKNIKINELLQEAFFVPDTKKIHSLFSEMKSLKKHMAILIDEYGGVSGIVTLEDLLEEIVGNISDEYDKDSEDIQKIGNNKFLVNASININELNEILKTNISSNNYDLLNGVIIEKLGYIPTDINKKEELIIENLKIRIIKLDNKRIDKVLIEII